MGIASRRIRTIEMCPFDSALYLVGMPPLYNQIPTAIVGSEDSWLMIRSIDGTVKKRISAPNPVWSSCWTAHNKVTSF